MSKSYLTSISIYAPKKALIQWAPSTVTTLSWVQYKCPYLKRKEHFAPTEPIYVSTWRQRGDIQYLWVVWLFRFMRGITSPCVLWVNNWKTKCTNVRHRSRLPSCNTSAPKVFLPCCYHPFPLPPPSLLPPFPSPTPLLKLCEHSRLETCGAQKVMLIENTRMQNAAIN